LKGKNMKRRILAGLIIGVAFSALVVPALAGAEFPPQAASVSAAQAPGDSPGDSPFLSKVDHLRIAAEHLEAAGLKDDAQRILQIAAAESREPRAFIQVDLRMVDIPMSKLAEMSSERYGGNKDMSALALLTKLLSANAPPGSRDLAPSSDPKLLALIGALLRDGFVEVLAEPSLMVTSGVPATVGDYQGAPVGRPGIRADVLAGLAANDQIHLDFRLRKWQLDSSGGFCAGMPSIKILEIKTALDLHSGQTAVVGIGGTRVVWRTSQNGEEMRTFVLVRAQVLRKETATKTATEK
jgi:hypothetical protein